MRISTLIFCLLCFGAVSLRAQEAPARWAIRLDLAQHPASLAVPRFNPLHPGLRAGLVYHWNQHPRHRLKQGAYLGYFYHQHLQHAAQLYTELSYEWVLGQGVRLTPLALGGGYVLSVSDAPSVTWDPSSQGYVSQAFPARSNWLLSLGSELAFSPGWEIARRPFTLALTYRIQVQGVFMRENIPVMAYAPLMLGLSLPLQATD
ncbi:MAG: hypothetical protein D6722_29435 [Bacteroidetes bacterium]|nr:MAG: hypothetical protein D6722_29435 [Bacteroidota bacterium]